MKGWLERRGAIFGAYRWPSDSYAGPPPLVGFVLRPRDPSWTRLELIVRGRSFYFSWGHRDEADE